jgi:hypothetical protein
MTPLSDVELDQLALILSDKDSVGDLEPFIGAPKTPDEGIVSLEEDENFYEANRSCGEHGC